MASSKMRKLEQAHIAFKRKYPKLYETTSYECACRAREIIKDGKQ